jgi:hypothetical protein
MGRWFQRASLGNTRWIGNNSIPFNGYYIVSNYTNGNLYTVDYSNFTEDGNEFVMELWCPNVHHFPDGLIIDRLDVDIISGAGLAAGSADVTAPMIAVDYSDDGGKTFKGERTASLGMTGQYNQMVRMNGWGRTSQKGRIWRFRASPSVMRGIIQASLAVRQANA